MKTKLIATCFALLAFFSGCKKDKDGPTIIITMTTVSENVKIYMCGTDEFSIDWGDGSAIETYIFEMDETRWIISSTNTHCYSDTFSHTITITGKNITTFDCSSNQLTSLDLSINNKLKWLICSNNQLTSLNMKKNTELGVLDCSDNQLDAAALNIFFKTLHNRKMLNKGIYISNNPGTDGCDPSIATAKGWLVL